jgi:hypothetical protein
MFTNSLAVSGVTKTSDDYKTNRVNVGDVHKHLPN